ncbi:MAG: hypothetical protein U0Q16_19840 [Bryobacteraceae bacterium]
MSGFEKQLKDTLARQEPPAGFADRVLSRVADETERASWWRANWFRWSTALASLAILTVGGWRYQEYRQGESAKQQLMLALEITAEKLAKVEQKIGR